MGLGVPACDEGTKEPSTPPSVEGRISWQAVLSRNRMGELRLHERCREGCRLVEKLLVGEPCDVVGEVVLLVREVGDRQGGNSGLGEPVRVDAARRGARDQLGAV